VNDQELAKRMSELDDVELVRLLTTQADKNRPEVLAAAEAEANRRGVPIDPAFIPPPNEEALAPEDAEQAGEASRFEAGGRTVVCTHCGHDLFESKDILLNTRGLTFFNLDWLNRSAMALLCANCGLVQIFTGPVEAVAPGD